MNYVLIVWLVQNSKKFWCLVRVFWRLDSHINGPRPATHCLVISEHPIQILGSIHFTFLDYTLTPTPHGELQPIAFDGALQITLRLHSLRLKQKPILFAGCGLRFASWIKIFGLHFNTLWVSRLHASLPLRASIPLCPENNLTIVLSCLNCFGLFPVTEWLLDLSLAHSVLSINGALLHIEYSIDLHIVE